MTKNISVRAKQVCFCADQKRHREGEVFFIPDVSHFSENGMEFLNDESGKLMEEFFDYREKSVKEAPANKAKAAAEAKKLEKKFPSVEKAVEKNKASSDQDVI